MPVDKQTHYVCGLSVGNSDCAYWSTFVCTLVRCEAESMAETGSMICRRLLGCGCRSYQSVKVLYFPSLHLAVTWHYQCAQL